MVIVNRLTVQLIIQVTTCDKYRTDTKLASRTYLLSTVIRAEAATNPYRTYSLSNLLQTMDNMHAYDHRYE